MSDKCNTQVEASIKAKVQLYCLLPLLHGCSSKWLGPPIWKLSVVKRVLGSKRPCFTSINIVRNSTERLV